MNYYKARQRKDGKWDYTCMNDGHIWPIGYCESYKQYSVDEWWSRMITEEKRADHDRTADKHHVDGHASASEAEACYRQYLLDHCVRLKGVWEQQSKCEVCGEWTQLYASVNNTSYFDLCEEHNTLEQVEKLFEGPGEVWSS
jgi:hypothetical protein